MITLFNGSFWQNAMGCRMETLYNCCREMKNAVDIYHDGESAVLCRFEKTLLVSGECCFEEILKFAEITGIDRIETDKDPGVIPCGWRKTDHPVLFTDCRGEEKIPYLRDLKGCFDIISSSDESFYKNADYLYWLSDMTRRQNLGMGKAYCRDGATAAVSAISDKAAYLSSVAVLPELRKNGRALSLIKTVISDEALCGKRLFTAAQHKGLIPFYQKAGFSVCGESFIIFEKEHP